MPDIYGYYDESRLRGLQPSAGYSAPDYVPDASTPININQGTYYNGRSFAGTGSTENPGGGNVPMSDASYRLLMSNLGQIPTDRDVLGGGKFGARGWLNDHPEGTIAAFIAAAAAGSALSGYGLTGTGGVNGAAAAPAAEGGSMGFGGAGTGGIPADLAGDFAGTQMGAAGNGLVLQGGAGTIGGSWLGGVTKYGPKVAGLLNQGGGGSGGAAPVSMPSMPSMGFMGSPQAAPMSSPRQQMPLNQTMQRSRGYMRTPINFRGSTIWV